MCRPAVATARCRDPRGPSSSTPSFLLLLYLYLLLLLLLGRRRLGWIPEQPPLRLLAGADESADAGAPPRLAAALPQSGCKPAAHFQGWGDKVMRAF